MSLKRQNPTCGASMNLLEQCQKWNENEEYQKIIDALEAIPAADRTPEMDSKLAQACNNLAEPGDRELFQKAIGLLEPHESCFAGDHNWNFRMGYAYYYLDQEGIALHYFEQALEARPGDEDTLEFIDDCLRCLSLPRFEKNFRQRTEEAWAAFSEMEGELRTMIGTDGKLEQGELLLKTCSQVLELAFCDPAFELGFNGEKYELILSPEGKRSALFPLVYFQQHAPKSILEHWNILVGRQPSQGFSLRTGDIEVKAEDVQVWVQPTTDDRVSLTVYCERLLPLLSEDPDRSWWLLFTLMDQVLGEVSSIAFVDEFDQLAVPRDESSVSLADLPQTLQNMGFSLWNDAKDYLDNSYICYEITPVEDPAADWRLDVFTGSVRLPSLINDYMAARSDVMDEYHKDGITAGFLCYPLSGFDGEDRGKRILDFRDSLQETLQKTVGDDAITFLGGATGLYYGYLDFIAWDLPAVLDAARAFFAGTDLTWGSFHVFRRDMRAVRLWKQKEPKTDPETGSLLSAKDIETLESFDDGVSGYFSKMLHWLEDFVEQGVQKGQFTEQQARQDLQIALWYSFACNNLDVYRYYYKAAQWMKDSEKNAGGCATWYYRYSVALMYCSRLEEALDYAEQGIKEEPDYPWIWLQVGKLLAHFGNKTGALEAVEHGLALEPGDYEFLTLKSEIEADEPLERMEYHWINPDADQTLQQGLDEDSDEKQQSISCITLDPKGLECFWSIFGPKPESYLPNAPFTQFPYTVKEHTFDLMFQMNEAGMSKLQMKWLEKLKSWLQGGQWLERKHPDGREGILDTVVIGLDYHIGLLYKLTDNEQYFQIFLRPDGTEIEDAFWSSEDGIQPELYSEMEMEAVEQHIQKYFGTFEKVFHELVSPDIHVDICVVPPTEERNYYTLITMGMGAHQMNIPEELAEYGLERAELVISLSPDWRLDEESMADERWYWPVRLLKVLARLPITSNTWLGWGHTMDHQQPFAEDTDLCGAILTEPQNVNDDSRLCQLPGGKELNFYQVIPLYREELEYKIQHDAETLLKRQAEVGFVVHPNRPSCIFDPSAAD